MGKNNKGKENKNTGQYGTELPLGRMYTQEMEKFAKSLGFRIATIRSATEAHGRVYENYRFKGSDSFWDDRLIECEEVLEPIEDRFEILDL